MMGELGKDWLRGVWRGQVRYHGYGLEGRVCLSRCCWTPLFAVRRSVPLEPFRGLVLPIPFFLMYRTHQSSPPPPPPCLQASVADAASSTGRVRGRGGMAAGIASPKASVGPILASAAPSAPVGGGGGSSSGQDAVKDGVEADGAAAGAEDGMGDGEGEEVSTQEARRCKQKKCIACIWSPHVIISNKNNNSYINCDGQSKRGMGCCPCVFVEMWGG